MRTEITYSQLLALRDDIIRQQQQSAAFFFFNREKVNRFFSLNNINLGILKKRMDDFVTHHVKHDENNQPCKQEIEGRLNYVFADEEEKQKYLDAVNNFLSLTIKMDL